MKSKNNNKIADALSILFLAVFAMPFFGGYLMLDEEKETKIIGGFLCIIGLVIWFLFGIN